jgi:hypothetical protein
MERIRALIADDETAVREALTDLIGSDTSMELPAGRRRGRGDRARARRTLAGGRRPRRDVRARVPVLREPPADIA